MSELDDPHDADQTNSSAGNAQSEVRQTTRLARQNSTENGTDPDWPYMFTTNIRLGIALDDWDEYESGAIDATRNCDQQARILAFGAIRRAAAVARESETHAEEARERCAYYVSAADEARRTGADNLDALTRCYGLWKGDEELHDMIAVGARMAIRAAIGSDKA